MADEIGNGGGGDQGLNPDGGSDLNQGGSPAAPAPVSLTDDSLVSWDGAKEPVKFGSLRGLQSQFTKTAQQRAKLEKDLATERTSRSQLENQLKQLQSRAQQQGRPDPLAEIRNLPYLSGQEAAGVVQNLHSALQQRDSIIAMLAQRFSQVEQTVQGLNRNHVTQSFDSKINRVLDDLGLDRDYAMDAKAFYLAHEGEDLDDEFPELYKKHVEHRREIEKRIAAKQRDAAKKPFVPGKGGHASGSGAMSFAGKTPKQQADLLWDALQAGDAGKT